MNPTNRSKETGWRRVTGPWLSQQFHTMKQASYHDKLLAVYAEKNPFYLLEWLVFPPAGAELDEWSYLRSPSMTAHGVLPFSQVFFWQIVYEVCLSEQTGGDIRIPLIARAIRDLRQVYGASQWDAAAQGCAVTLREQLATFQTFLAELDADRTALRLEFDRTSDEYKRLAEEAHTPEEAQSFEDQLSDAARRYRQKHDEAPGKRLKGYDSTPVVAFLYYKNWPDPARLIAGLTNRIADGEAALEHEFLFAEEALAGRTALCADWLERLAGDVRRTERFARWYAACADKTLFNRGIGDTAERRLNWLRFLEFLASPEPRGCLLAADEAAQAEGIQQADGSMKTDPQQGVPPDSFKTAEHPLFEAFFNIAGMDEEFIRLAEEQAAVPACLHRLTLLSLGRPELRKRLRERIILRSWPVFSSAFAAENYDFNQLSWVLCLDPPSLEERLLRRKPDSSKGPAPALAPLFVIERICEVFADALRLGLDEETVVPLFQYLSVHDREFMARYVLRIRDFTDLAPVLRMRDLYLFNLFAGSGGLVAAARGRLQQLLLGALSDREQRKRFVSELDTLTQIVEPFKRDIALAWLEQYDQSGDRLKGNREARNAAAEQAAELSQRFRLEWLGLDADKDAQQRMVKHWLEEHSDRLQFETDLPAAEAGIRYTILRPGVIDCNTGETIARVRVRAEMADRQQIFDLLDDLKNL